MVRSYMLAAMSFNIAYVPEVFAQTELTPVLQVDSYHRKSSTSVGPNTAAHTFARPPHSL